MPHFINEKRITLVLSSIFGLRFIGLFMVLPLISQYAEALPGSTPLLMGMSVGIYGLTQMLFQLPLGFVSDYVGRKRVILAGLAIFTLGGFVASLWHSLAGLMLGRALQGAGAVGSTIIALLTDVVSEHKRTRAMAILGITIGSAFSLAIMLGPILNVWFHINGIFAIAGLMGCGALWLAYREIPELPIPIQIHPEQSKITFPVRLLFNSRLSSLYLNVGLLHYLLTSIFVVLPFLFEERLQLTRTQQSGFYVSLLVVAIGFTLLLLRAEKRIPLVHLMKFCIILICTSALAMLFFTLPQFLFYFLILVLFFTGFNFLEACLPGLIAKHAPDSHRGTAMGLYSSSQFLGIFLGGTVSGWLYGHFSFLPVFITNVVISVLWLLLTLRIWPDGNSLSLHKPSSPS